MTTSTTLSSNVAPSVYEMHHEGQDILDALKRPQAYIRDEVHEVHHDAPHGDV